MWQKLIRTNFNAGCGTICFVHNNNKISVQARILKGKSELMIWVNDYIQGVWTDKNSEIGKAYYIPVYYKFFKKDYEFYKRHNQHEAAAAILEKSKEIMMYTPYSTSPLKMIKHLESIEGLKYIG